MLERGFLEIRTRKHRRERGLERFKRGGVRRAEAIGVEREVKVAQFLKRGKGFVMEDRRDQTHRLAERSLGAAQPFGARQSLEQVGRANRDIGILARRRFRHHPYPRRHLAAGLAAKQGGQGGRGVCHEVSPANDRLLPAAGQHRRRAGAGAHARGPAAGHQ
ncbi:MAG: hypothetical protein WDN76_01185 [Alphaproteobacteria bacterium]